MVHLVTVILMVLLSGARKIAQNVVIFSLYSVLDKFFVNTTRFYISNSVTFHNVVMALNEENGLCITVW